MAAAGLARSLRHAPRPDLRAAARLADSLNARYLGLGTPLHLAVLSAAALAFYLAPGTLASLACLGLLFLAMLPRPDLGLALVAFSLPFFLLPKVLLGRTISLTEVNLVLVALAYVVRRGLVLAGAFGQHQPSGRVTWLDRAAWLLTGMALLAGLLTVAPFANTGVLAATDWPTQTLLLLPLAGVLAVFAQAREEGHPLMGTTRGLDLGVLALVVLSLAATLAAQNFGVSLQEFHVVVWDGAAFYVFVRLARGSPQVNAERLAWRLADAFLLGASLMALYAIYQFFFTDQAITAEGVHRALGVYGSPNNLALLLDRAAPILLAVVVAASPRPASAQEGAARRLHLRRVLYGLCLIPVLLAILLTFSRGALLLGLPAAFLFIGIVRGGRVLWGMLGATLLALLGLIPFLGTERFRSMLDLHSGTGFFRLRLWQSAWAMLRDHPWLGVGLDNFLYEYRTRYILPDAWQEPNLSHPHNILLDFGTRLGLGGIVVLGWLQVAFWRLAWHDYRRHPQAGVSALRLGLMASMVATLAHGLLDNSFFLVDLGFIFLLTLGLVARLAAASE